MNRDRLNDITKEFILNEGEIDYPKLKSSIQSALTLIDSINPRTKRAKKNLIAVKREVKGIRRQVRRILKQKSQLEEKLEELESQEDE